jgi:hypothetical protein
VRFFLVPRLRLGTQLPYYLPSTIYYLPSTTFPYFHHSLEFARLLDFTFLNDAGMVWPSFDPSHSYKETLNADA